MNRLALEVPETLRAQLRQRCEDAPETSDISKSELVDLTFHAVSEAVAAIELISARAPNQMAQMMVMSLAIATAAELLKSTQHAMIEQILQSFPSMRGARS